LRLAQQGAEHALRGLNRRYWRDPERQAQAARTLGIGQQEMARSVAYAEDRHRFGLAAGWLGTLAALAFLALGGLGLAERWAWAMAGGLGSVAVGLTFFALLGLAHAAFEAPVAAYATFVIEQRHGFNRQGWSGFLADQLKGLALGAALGGLLLAGLLSLMEQAGPAWWAGAWAFVSGFSLLTAWAYPTLLAPLFNRFTPLPAGELRERIDALAARAGFRLSGVLVMDASRRSSHGNAYFTGLLGARRIVLFDTLLEGLAPVETAAVLAHELGHFRLRHVRRALARSVLLTGASFYALSRVLSYAPAYGAFALAAPTAYGALAVFALWLGPVGFLARPLLAAISRRDEFAADAYAVRLTGSAEALGDALLKLRERSAALPLAHPLFSCVYHSHPPLLERLAALGRRRAGQAGHESGVPGGLVPA
jgi:STE24 endopeptidase